MASPTDDPITNPSGFRRLVPVFGLFLLSPLVAEFLLGNIAIDAIWTLPFMAPLYGGGAVLVREVARRTGRGWPGLLLLALAYAVVEEGLVTQSLFNARYFGFDIHGPAVIPALGMDAWWTVYVLTIHTVWSVAVPIAMVEAFVPGRASSSWLGRWGQTAVAGVFLFGAVLNGVMTHQQERFLASGPQLFGTSAVVAGLILAASVVRRPAPRMAGAAPGVWRVGLASLLASSLFTLGLYAPGWPVVGFWLVLFAAFAGLVVRGSGRRG